MKIPARAQIPAVLSSEPPNPSPEPVRERERRTERRAQRRRYRVQGFSSNRSRLRKDAGPPGRRSGPGTPLLRWKFNDGDVSIGEDNKAPAESGRRGRRKASGVGEVCVSARKLAAGLWHLRYTAGNGGGNESGVLDKSLCYRWGVEPGVGHSDSPFHCHRERREPETESKELLQSPFHFAGPNDGFLCKVEPSTSFPNSAMEGATKWDPVCTKTSDMVYQFNGQMKLLQDHQVTTGSVVAALQTELEVARTRIQELEMERRSSKKKLEHFLRKLAEEKASWQSREHQKIRATIDDVKDELNRERKNRQRTEIVNSKLVNELADAKLSVKRIFQDYEKERKSRELMEEVCDELAKEIGEDKAEVEALKRECTKIREEVEEERKMLQMAEVWREERVQMKLIDAKVALEDKYSQMNKIIADLEAFLRSRIATPDVAEMKEAEKLLEAASMVKIHDIKEFTYEPPNSEDIFSVFEDRQTGEANEREIVPCPGYSPASQTSKIRTVSPDYNERDQNGEWRHTNGLVSQNRNMEEDGSGWETVSQAEEQGSSNSPDGSDPSVNKNRRDSNVSVSGKGWEDVAGHDTPDTEISEICSISARQSKKKASSISRLWRSNGENCKIVSVEAMNGRLSKGRLSTGGIISPDRGTVEGGFSPNLVGHWSSPDSGNLQIARGMKGCIDWPRSAQKNSLKAKLLEARMESQKIQLRHVLKQKI